MAIEPSMSAKNLLIVAHAPSPNGEYKNTLVVMIALLTLGMVLRVIVPTWIGFLSGTVMLTLAIGFANTLAAPIIKQRTPNNIPLVTGLFSLTMTVSAGIVAGVVLPLSEWVGWQWAIGGWAIFGVFGLVLWIFLRIDIITNDITNKIVFLFVFLCIVA